MVDSVATALHHVVCGGTPPFTYFCSPWYDSFYGDITVPDSSGRWNDGAVFSLWTGLLTDQQCVGCSSLGLLQPVLSWFNGRYTIKAEWVNATDGSDYQTSGVFVLPGDVIHTNTYVNANNPTCSNTGTFCNWTVTAYDDQGANATLYVIAGGGVFNDVYRMVLEAPCFNCGVGNPPWTGGWPYCSDLPPQQYAWFSNTQAFQPGTSALDYRYLAQFWNDEIHASGPTSPDCDYNVYYPGYQTYEGISWNVTF
jgi:hypothetical protein